MFTENTTLKVSYWLLGWVAINLLQAAFSPIDADEAYYWMYAGQLDWGYFDHPPAVAALIALGRDWLPGSLGLRFGHVLAGTLTAWAIWQLLDRPTGKDAWLAALLITVQPMLQVYGFIATPDGPLLLFTALLLWKYKSFLSQPSYQNGLLLGLIMAALLYSKYHGVLLILFVILPNLRWLVSKPAAWLAVGLGALLYVPHLYWQYAHDFPSFRYHLSGRNDPYQFKYTTEFLLNQLVIFNPFLVYFYVRSLFDKPETSLNTPGDRFYRSCRWLVVLTFGFFLYSTSKGGTEAQWTAMLCVPLVVIAYQGIRRHPAWYKLVVRLCILSLGLFALARIALMLPQDWLPFKKPFDAAPWVAELEEIAGDRPVVFENSYRDPSHYQFYSGRPASTFTDVYYRPSQFDIWRSDTALQGREVLLVGKENWSYPPYRAFTPQTKRLRTAVIQDFEVAKFVRFSLADTPPASVSPGEKIELEILAVNTENFTVNLRGELPLQPFVLFQQFEDGWFWVPLDELEVTAIGPGEPTLLYRGGVKVPPNLPAGEYSLQFGLGYQGMPPLRGQSDLWPVSVAH